MIRLRNIVWSNLVLFGILMSEVNSTLSKSTTDSNCHTLKSPHIFQIFNIRNKNNCLHELGWSCDQILWSPKIWPRTNQIHIPMDVSTLLFISESNPWFTIAGVTMLYSDDISTASVKSPQDLWRHHRFRERWIV